MGALSESRAPNEPPQTPKKLLWLAQAGKNQVNEALSTLGSISNISFPLPSDEQSPAKKNKSPTHEIKRLFSQLFYTDRDALVRQVGKFLDWLPLFESHNDKLQYLQDALSIANEGSVRSKRSARIDRMISPAVKQALNGSPTMLAKHVPNSSVKDLAEIELTATSKVTSNTTSANTSFWSEAQNVVTSGEECRCTISHVDSDRLSKMFHSQI